MNRREPHLLHRPGSEASLFEALEFLLQEVQDPQALLQLVRIAWWSFGRRVGRVDTRIRRGVRRRVALKTDSTRGDWRRPCRRVAVRLMLQ